MSPIGQFLEEHVWPRLDAAESALLDDLHPKKSRGYWAIECPDCKKRRAFYYPGGSIRCNRIESCGYNSSVWTYLRDYKGLPKKEILKLVCDAVGVTPPNSNTPPSKNAIDYKLRSILQGFFPQGAQSIQRRWNYTDAQMATLSKMCGYYPSIEAVQSQLNPNDLAAAKQRGWLRPELANRLVGFWKQLDGSIRCWARDLSGKSNEKYLFLYGMTKTHPYLYEECLPGKAVAAVEGGRDAIALLLMGIPNAVATGGNHLNFAQARYLSTRSDSVIYVTDGDIAGMKGIVNTVRNCCHFGLRAEFVVLPKSNGFDPDEYREKGLIPEFTELWSKRIGAGTALALSYISAQNDSRSGKLCSDILSLRTELATTERGQFDQTLSNYGIHIDPIKDALRDLSVLVGHFPLEQANQLIARRYGFNVEIVRSENSGI